MSACWEVSRQKRHIENLRPEPGTWLLLEMCLGGNNSLWALLHEKQIAVPGKSLSNLVPQSWDVSHCDGQWTPIALSGESNSPAVPQEAQWSLSMDTTISLMEIF